MKVLHVAPSFARRDGGPSEVLRGLIPHQTAVGLNVRTFSTDKGTVADDFDFARENHVRVFRSAPPKSWTFAPGMVLPLLIAIRGADVVHVHSVNTFTSTIAMAFARLFRIPYILEPHGALDDYHMAEGATKKSLYNATLDRFGLRGLSGAIYSSERELEHGERRLPAPSFMMPLGVDPSLFLESRSRPNPEATPTVLFLGRVTQKKRLDLVLRALATSELSSMGARLIVAGPVDDRLQYSPEDLVRKLNLGERVEFLGRVGAATRLTLLSMADAFVLASEDESFGVAVAESLAAGCPVVASGEVGIAKAAAAKGALVLCELESASIANAVAGILRNPEAARAQGETGRQYARDHFTWEIAALAARDAYSAVYQQ